MNTTQKTKHHTNINIQHHHHHHHHHLQPLNSPKSTLEMRPLNAILQLLLLLLLSLAAVVVPVVYSKTIIPLHRVLPVTHHHGLDLDSLRARDRLRHARILQGVVGGVVDFSVQGSADPLVIGLYFTKVKIGSPAREFNVQIDTGSDVLWVTCSSCNDCPRTSGLGMALNFFDTASSSSAYLLSCSHPLCASGVQTSSAQCFNQNSQCGYSFKYGDGSGTSGYYVEDQLSFDMILQESMVANSSAPVVFGCSTYQSGDLTRSDKAIDGIFGFGPGDLSVISQLASRGLTPRIFSHCLKGDSNGGGIMVLGEILDPSIVYSPLVPSRPHYNLYLQSIAVNGQLLPIDPAVFATSDNQGTIVDSGTTLAYLVQDALDPLVKTITSAVSQYATPVISQGMQCFLVSSSISEIFPPVSLNFAGGASMVLKPEEYLIHTGFTGGAALWCMGFDHAQGGVSILGDIVLKDKIVVYDLAHQRIGWAPYDCSMAVNVSITSGKDEYINAGQLSVSSTSKDRPCSLLVTLFLTLLAHLGLFKEFQFL